MATDIGRISAAMSGIEAVEYDGPERQIALEFLDNLKKAVRAAEAAPKPDGADAVRDVFNRLFGVDGK